LCVTEDNLYYTSYHGFVTKLNRYTGEVIWRRMGDCWIHSSPIVDINEKKVYFSTEYRSDVGKPGGDLVCLDSKTGDLIWRSKTSDLMPCTPFLDHDLIFVSSNDCYAYCFNSINRTLIWKHPMKSPTKGQPLIIKNDAIFVNEGGWIYIFEKTTGVLKFLKQCSSGFRHVIPIKTREEDCFIVGDIDGYIKCFDLNLVLQWIVQTRGSLNWYPAQHNNILYFTSLNGYLLGIDAESKTKIECNYLDESGCPIAINDNYIVINYSNKGLTVYDRKN